MVRSLGKPWKLSDYRITVNMLSIVREPSSIKYLEQSQKAKKKKKKKKKLQNEKRLFFLQHDSSDPSKKQEILPLGNYLFKVNHKRTRVISVYVGLVSVLLTLRRFLPLGIAY